jgi:hypothetical protein
VGAVADMRNDLLGEVGGVDGDGCRAGQSEAGQAGQCAVEQRDVADRAERLGQRCGERTQSLSLAGRQDDAADRDPPAARCRAQS